MSDSHRINVNPEDDVSTRADPVSTRLPNKEKLTFTDFLKIISIISLSSLVFPIFGVPASLLLLISLLVIRIFQFIKSGDEYEKLSRSKHYYRFILVSILFVNLVGLWHFCLITKYIYFKKEASLLEMPLKKWAVLISKLYGLFFLSHLINYVVAKPYEVIVMHGGSRTAGQAISEIFDSFIFWWATNFVMKHVPYIKHHEILGLPTRNWIWVSVLILTGHNGLILFTRTIVWFLPNLFLVFIDLCYYIASRKVIDKYPEKELKKLQYVMYYANGMIPSICFVISSLVLLLTWNFYFGSHLDLKSANIRCSWEYGRWTFISLLICSVFWLIKNLVLLVWEAHTVYDRLERQIKTTSQQLYFLGILGAVEFDFLKILAKPGDFNKETIGLIISDDDLHSCNGIFSALKLLPSEVRKTVQNDLLFQSCYSTGHKKKSCYSKYPPWDDIQRASKYFAVAKQHLSEETYISDVLAKFQSSGQEKMEEVILGQNVHGTTKLSWSHTEKEPVKKEQDQEPENSMQNVRGIDNVQANNKDDETKQSEQLERHVAETSCEGPPEKETHKQNEQQQDSSRTSNDGGKWKSDWSQFLEELKDIKKENSVFKENQDNSDYDIVGFSELQTWVERAHNRCMNLANTLNSAKELADCLDKIISWLLIGAIIIMWLLVTRLATTKVLVLIASPLVAASFIFGETCKTLFQGIVYVFVVHPFDVGDLCVIEGNTMEVRSIGIWSTTLKKLDKFGSAQEFEIHSNSQLMNKTIINHRRNFDWSDRLELNLGPVDCEGKVEDKHASIIKFFMHYLKQEDRGNQQKPAKEEEEDRGNQQKPNNQEICSKLDTGKGSASKPVDDKDEKCPKRKKFSTLLSSSPHLSILAAKEDSITLVIHLVYKAGKTKNWTHSECLRRKDELKGDFHLCMLNLISEFKVLLLPLNASLSQNYAIGVQEHAKLTPSSLEETREETTRIEEIRKGWRFDMVDFKFDDRVPPAIYDHIIGWNNVKGDGNCGFRCVADAFCGGQDNWEMVRQAALGVLYQNRSLKLYQDLYHNNVTEALNRIEWKGGPCGKEHEMQVYGDLFLIANYFKCTIFFFGMHDISCTIFPLDVGCLNVRPPQRELAIAHLGDDFQHFICLKLRDGHPIPPINTQWNEYANVTVDEWPKFYRSRVKQWLECKKP